MPPTTRARSGSRSPANPFAPKPGASATPSKAKGKPAPVSFEAGIEKEVREHWIDVPCSWALLSTIAGLCFAGDYLIPPICGTSEGSFLTFSCPDAIIFGWIFCWTAFLVKMLPPQTNNPMELWFCSGMPLRKRAVKFVLQLLAALSFAFAMKHFAKDFAEKVYTMGAPKVHLCAAASAGAPHHKHFKGDANCVHEWPSFSGGKFAQGAVINEALHVFFLNYLVALLCPHAGKYFNFVIAGLVITTLRSPYTFTGPGLNMVPSMMAASLYGGFEALRVHLFGTFIGMFLASWLEHRSGVVKVGFASALSWRPGQKGANKAKKA